MAESTVDELLELVRIYARVAVAFVGEFSHGRRIVRFVSGEGPAATTLVDRSHDLGQTYCKLVAEQQIPTTIPDVRAVPMLRALPITAELDIGCYVGVPIHLSDGTLYGTLCGFSHEPVDELDADLVWLLNVVAKTLARRIETPADAFVDVLAIHERVEAVLAVDDLGAGFAGLTRLVDLDPEIVKVDRFLTIGVAEDPRRSALLSAALHFCRSTGAVLVAEGVERPEDLATIVDLDVPLAQGYLLGRPAPPGTPDA